MNNEITINFDMDGTLVDLYGVQDWLPRLRAEDETPYLQAKPLCRLNYFARLVNQLQKQGYKIAIISWLAKEGTQTYNDAVINAKVKWLAKHLPSVHWDRITLVKYGTPKQIFAYNEQDILFDDNRHVRKEWRGIAYDEKNMLPILQGMII